ncbi:MAG: SPFH domain-containing protein [Thermoplasmata archaeon]
MSLFGSQTFAWEDVAKRGNIVWRHPRNIRLNDNIVVREDEIAVFYRDGKALAYIDRPARYALTSINAPVVGPIVKLLSGVKQRAEVYYIQKRPFDGKFGSKQPYQFRDPEFQVVTLRVFGQFRYKVSSPENFINQFVGTLNLTTAATVEERIREQMVLVTYDSLGEMKSRGLAVLDLAANLEEIEQVIIAKCKSHFEPYGIEVVKVHGLNINLPEEVQKAVDARSSMAITGTGYVQYQTGQAMRDAAVNPAGGGAGAGVGIGAGIGMGYQMADTMRQPSAAAPPGQPCIKCGGIIPTGSKFCNVCGARQEDGTECPGCRKFVPRGSKFCPQCGSSLSAAVNCPKCKAEVPRGSKFCHQCGAKLGE